MEQKANRFPIVVKRGSSVVKNLFVIGNRTGTYLQSCVPHRRKTHRWHFNDLEKAISEAEAKAARVGG